MKNVLITGGSRGIGAEIVKAFALSGHNVYFFYKNSDESAMKLAKLTGATAIRCDVGDAGQVTSGINTVKKSALSIDILVNNAGISSIKPFGDISYEEWREMTAVTLDGAFFCTKAVLPDMLSKGWGRIINISSMWGSMGASCEVHYSTVKAGLLGFTRALAKELAISNITVNAVSPGFIDTDMNSHLSESEKEEFISSIPAGRAGNPDDVANAVLFLSKDESSYITGQNIGVNGGYTVN